MLKGFILTFSLNSETMQCLKNTSIISQTQSGPQKKIPMVYYTTLDASMFQIPEISASMFSNTCTITPLQVIQSDEASPSSSNALWSRHPIYIKDYCKLCVPQTL